jgi:hypothetical protein
VRDAAQAQHPRQQYRHYHEPSHIRQLAGQPPRRNAAKRKIIHDDQQRSTHDDRM